jgi:urease accessory protein
VATDSSRLLSLLRFSSPTLPIGSYAYSRGLEYALHAGWIDDEASALAWILGLLRHTGTRLEGPCLLRLLAAHRVRDKHAIERWNARLLASRESAELRLEDTQLGAAFARLLVGLGMTRAQAWSARADTCYANMFALACEHEDISSDSSLLAYLWALSESQVSAAVRLLPLGQSAGQRMLSAIGGALPECASAAIRCSDRELGALAPGLAIASALHETQYTRLFRS